MKNKHATDANIKWLHWMSGLQG